MSKRDRRDGDRGRDRRESQPDEEQQRRLGEADLQESESLTALKAILSKVASLLNPLQLSQEESIRLVEQLYGSVLAMDTKMAGESDDSRKSSVLYHVQNTAISRTGDKLVVEYPPPRTAATDAATATDATTATDGVAAAADTPRAPSQGARPSTSAEGAPVAAGGAASGAAGAAGDAPAARPRSSAAGRPPTVRVKPRVENQAPTAEPQQPKTDEPAPVDSGPPED